MFDPVKKHLDKTFYYLNELYSQAISIRNQMIETATESKNPAVATRMISKIEDINKLYHRATDKLASSEAEFNQLLKSVQGEQQFDYQTTYNEKKILWQNICDKIKFEAEELGKISDMISQGQLQVFEKLEAFLNSGSTGSSLADMPIVTDFSS